MKKKLLPLFVIFMSVFFSCNVSIPVNQLVQRNQIRSVSHYSLVKKDNYFLCNTKIAIPSKLNQFKLNQRMAIDSEIVVLGKNTHKTSNEIERKSYLLKQKMNLHFVIDSIADIQIIISFNEKLLNVNYDVKTIYQWDYFNWRFLGILLPIGNSAHIKNQCINRAIDACLAFGASGAIIEPNLFTYKLIDVK